MYFGLWMSGGRSNRLLPKEEEFLSQAAAQRSLLVGTGDVSGARLPGRECRMSQAG